MRYPLAECVISCAQKWEGESLRKLIEALGGQFSEVLTSYCTHVVTCNTSTRRYLEACERFPETPIVHPQWLWACYWSIYDTSAPPMEPYMTDFLCTARRTGTCTSLGSRSQFFLELGRYHTVEDYVGVKGSLMASLLRAENYDDCNPAWGFVSRQLQDTVFWGRQVRDMNWRRRRCLAQCLLTDSNHSEQALKLSKHHKKKPNALRRLATMPIELRRAVLSYF